MKLCVLTITMNASMLAGTALAQPYPDKPLRILVGFSPGGASDITTRIVGQKLSETSNLWYGLLLPAAASTSVVAKLNKAVNDALRAPDLVERFAALGADPVGSTASAFGKTIAEEIIKWGRVIKSAGIRGE